MSDSKLPALLQVLGLILLVPAALGAGWLVGNLPGRAPAPPPAPAVSASQPTATRATAIRVDTNLDAKAPDAKPEEIVSGWTSYPAALDESKANGKPILLDFNADWCPPCQRMKEEVFDDSDVSRPIQVAVIPVSVVDRRRESGANPEDVETLQRRYLIDAFPTLVVFSPTNGRFEVMRGYGGPQRTVDWITGAAQAVR